MSDKTIYEWKVEQIDEHGDIKNLDFFDSADKAFDWATAYVPQWCVENVVVLVRDTFQSDGALLERLHAYPDDLETLKYFEEPSRAVPKRYKADYQRASKFAAVRTAQREMYNRKAGVK